MKKKLSILIALVMAISLCLSPAVAVSAASTPVIDGVIGVGEWDGAIVIPVADSMGTASIIASRDYLYMMFEGNDPTDARLGENLVGNDKLSININPTDGGSWGKPYDIIFETGTDPAAWQMPTCGPSDGYETNWVINGAQVSTLPADLETVTIYDYGTGTRTTEWRIPLTTISPLGTTILVGGNCDNLGNTGSGFKFPDDLEWAVASTYVEIPIPPAPVRSLNAFDVFVRFGYDSTRYNSEGALAGSIEAVGLYNDAQYMLEIPEGCVVNGAAGRINWLFLEDIDGDVLSFIGGDASFSESCVLYIAEGGRLYQDYWTGAWLGGTWVEVGSFTSIVGGEAVLE